MTESLLHHLGTMGFMTAKNTLSFDPNGAQITSFDTDFGDLFYLSSASNFGEGQAIRGGVPIVAPWFATFLGDQQHGWARRSRWHITENDTGYTASLSNDGFLLGLEVIAGNNEITARLSIENTSDESRSIQIAFHPYFAVDNAEETAVRGLDGEKFTDRTTDKPGTVSDDITFTGLVDVIVHSTKEVQIIDKTRVITITSNGADSTVVWNPGEKKADSMQDIGIHEWNDFVCVEPALLGEGQKGTQLAPGEINVLEMHVTVEAAR